MLPLPDTEWREAIRYFVEEGGLLRPAFRLEPYQTAFLRDPSTTRVALKSRQIGISWIFAAEALLHALLDERSLSLFVSLNEREAQEKVRTAEQIHDALPKRLKGKLIRSSREELEFSNGSRILSFPSRAPRGFSGANVYLDELAFYDDDRAVYLGALPVISRGGRLTLASTPFGQRGVFWETAHRAGLSTEEGGKSQEYRSHPRGYHEIPWWKCSWMTVEKTRDENSGGVSASHFTLVEEPPEAMDTAERVERFGSSRLKEIYAAMDRDSFQQEYECRFLDEEVAFISYAEIMPCVMNDLTTTSDLSGLSGEAGSLYAGYDVGRSVHPSELVVIEREPNGIGIVRLMKTLRNTAFNEQSATLQALLSHGNVRRLSLDATGIGSPLSEELTRSHPLRVEPVVFTAAVKERLAIDLKVALSRREIVLPPDRELIAQIRSIHRSFSVGGNTRLESETSGEAGRSTHADRFWALALAWRAASADPGRPLGVRVLGGR